MPSLLELRNRFHPARQEAPLSLNMEDSLVADRRSRLTPSQQVEQKLSALLLKPMRPQGGRGSTIILVRTSK